MHHLFEHWGDVLTGAIGGVTIWTIIAYAVNTAPTPAGVWGQWFLGIIKFAVAQKYSAMNAIRGQDTLIAAVPRGSGTGSGSPGAPAGTNEVKQLSVDLVDGATVVKESQEKTTVIPKPADPPKEKP